MLFNPGPLDPVDVDAATRIGPRSTFAADAARVAQQLGAGDGALGASQGAMASAWAPGVELGAGSDLAAAADAHDRQARDFDDSIGAVAGNADAHVGEIAGLSNDTAADIEAGEPGFPDYVDHPIPGTEGGPPPIGEAPPREPPPEPPDDEHPTIYDAIARLYRELLDREGSQGEIEGWVATGLTIDEIRAAFLDSPEYHEKHGG